MDPLKYIFEKPTLTGQIARWQMALSKYDIVYTSQKDVKRSALAEQLAYHPLNEYHPLSHEFPDKHMMVAEKDEPEAELDEWKLWFDGASNLLENEIGAVLASSKGQYFPFSARLGFDYTNNMAEYEACAMGITMAIEHQISKLKVFDDSALVIYQLREEWETRNAKRVPYHAYECASCAYVPRIRGIKVYVVLVWFPRVGLANGQDELGHDRFGKGEFGREGREEKLAVEG
ncbi:hypothetical protein CR513_58047, partial [Mucuna pruriens]